MSHNMEITIGNNFVIKTDFIKIFLKYLSVRVAHLIKY